MNQEEFQSLSTGDVVKGLLSGQTYIVTANYGDRVTAVQTVDITHSNEWELVLKASFQKPKSNE